MPYSIRCSEAVYERIVTGIDRIEWARFLRETNIYHGLKFSPVKKSGSTCTPEAHMWLID